jgi:hypothetical protein
MSTSNGAREKVRFKMDTADNMDRFFRVAFEGQTYLNILYLLLAFPLGLAYFIFLVTGLSLGLGLTIIWIGILILALMVAAWWGLAAVERQLAIWLLHVDIPPMSHPARPGQDVWARLKSHLTSPVTWKSLLYLFAKFPLGILSFVMVVTCISVSGALLTAPLTYPYGTLQIGLWQIDSSSEAWTAAGLGVLVTLISMHLMNGLAFVSGRFARLMLGIAASTPVSPRTEQGVAVSA